MSRDAVLYPLLTCNARCPFCSSRVYTADGIVAASDFLLGDTQRPLSAHTLSLEESFERYRQLRARGVERISLQGGEPTLYAGLLPLIAYGRELGFSEQIIVTNGRKLADANFASALARSGINTIGLSIFGATAAVHDHSLGGDGFFRDLVLGVRNLLAASGSAHVTGEFILHGHNFHELPAMLSFWYEQGLRSFGIRLLREVPNLEQDGARGWFFDLELLRPLLDETLSRACDLRDAKIVFPELPFCLVGDRHLGQALTNLAARRRLGTDGDVEGRNVNGENVHRKLPIAASSPCERCELVSVCARVEPPYDRVFSGNLRALRVNEIVSGLFSDDSPAAASCLAELADSADDLAVFGVDTAALARYRRGRDDELGDLDAALRAHLEDGTVIRYVSLRDVGVQSLGGPSRVLPVRLFAAASPEGRAKLRFLRDAKCVFSTPHLLAFAGSLVRPNGNVPYCVLVYDDAKLREADLAERVAAAHSGRSSETP